MSRALLLPMLLGAAFATAWSSTASDEAKRSEAVRAAYTKYEFMIAMRDGVRLFTSVYVPKDTSQTWPVLFLRTPYSVAPYGVDNYRAELGPSELFSKSKYIFVYQDVRGRFLSEGEFVNMRPLLDAHSRQSRATDESTDAWDTIEWLVKNAPNNNGRVGIWGVSYPGFYAACAMVDAHPALRAVSPQAPIADWFRGDDVHHNGALFLPNLFGFFRSFGDPREHLETKVPPPSFDLPDTGYQFYLDMGTLSAANDKYFHNRVNFWNEAMQHGNYDAWWQARSTLPHLRNIKPAVLVTGGWFDAEDLFGTLHTYESAGENSHNPAIRLAMGPWFHGGWAASEGDRLGNITFGQKTAPWYRENIEFPFFEYYLKEKGENALPRASVFETGTNQWRRYDSWPPKAVEPRTLYLHAGGKLGFDAPHAGEQSEYDEYVSDPNHPVPFIATQAEGMTREYMTEDQRFASTRTDVLTYQTERLESDLTVAGPIGSDLRVSSSGTDSDFVVKLIDVYPADYPDPRPNPTDLVMAGYQQLVRGDVMRGKFRDSFSNPQPFVPDQVARLHFVIPDVNHAFRRGHRIMIQIQSSWFPLVDRNPQRFEDIYTAKPQDFQKATQRVYHSAAAPSGVTVEVLR